jgi:hypothetical protein
MNAKLETDKYDPETRHMTIAPSRKPTFEEIHCNHCPKADTCAIHRAGTCERMRGRK